MRFTVFGGVSAWAGEREVDLGQAQRRAVLGILLIEAGRPVGLTLLIERIWGDEPPARARGQLQTWLWRLRQAVPDVIEREGAGYVARVDPLTVDLHVFRSLAASGKPAQALALVRGELLSSLDTAWVRRLRASFAAELEAVRRDHVDARLLAGEHAGLVDELRVQADRHPLDERIAAQLIEALHGSGRTQEAIGHFTAVEARLARELGAEPSRRLSTVRRRLLAAPRQLPAAPKPFTGRALELAQLDQAPTGVVVITGTGGVGKTSLAVHWAHHNAERFPDGQLYVNLHGFGPSRAVSPSDALLRFLSALDVPRGQVPLDLAGQSKLLQDTVRGKRILMLLDNATDTEQIRPLLPRSQGSHVVITSRAALKPAPGAHELPLGLLPPDDARELLASRIGHDRALAEPDAVDTVVRRCARLPLALAVAGARAATQPEFPLATLADELADLDAFADDDDVTADLRSVFSHSCRALSPAALRLFRLLGVMPGADISVAGAASLAGLDDVGELLAELTSASLLDEPAPGRFTCHDLLRDYAAELSRHTERAEAQHRLLDHLALTGVEMAVAMTQSRPRPATPAPAAGVVVTEPASRDEAVRWLITEHPTLMAAMRHGTPTQTWLIGWSLADVLDRIGHYQDLLTSQQLAAEALDRLDHRDGLVRTLINLGRAHGRMNQLDEATRALERAFEVAEGNPAAQADVLVNLAMLCPDDRTHQAIEYTRRALALYEEVGDTYGQANSLTGLSWAYGKLGEPEPAIEYGTLAMALWQELGHLLGQGETWDNFGTAHTLRGDHAAAVDALTRAIGFYERGGDRMLAAQAYDQLGDAHVAAGAAEQARLAWRTSIELYRTAAQPTEHLQVKLEAERQ